jgi:hypothetical protein
MEAQYIYIYIYLSIYRSIHNTDRETVYDETALKQGEAMAGNDIIKQKECLLAFFLPTTVNGFSCNRGSFFLCQILGDGA